MRWSVNEPEATRHWSLPSSCCHHCILISAGAVLNSLPRGSVPPGSFFISISITFPSWWNDVTIAAGFLFWLLTVALKWCLWTQIKQVSHESELIRFTIWRFFYTDYELLSKNRIFLFEVLLNLVSFCWTTKHITNSTVLLLLQIAIISVWSQFCTFYINKKLILGEIVQWWCPVQLIFVFCSFV